MSRATRCTRRTRPASRTVCQQRREEMREDTHTVREPEDLVALLPAPDHRAQNLRFRAVFALRRRRPDVRDRPRKLDAEDLARALRHCAPSALLLSPTLHGEHATGCMTLRCMMSIRFRPEVRISLSADLLGPGQARGAGFCRGRAHRRRPYRRARARRASSGRERA
jgi:hypothetical protein